MRNFLTACSFCLVLSISGLSACIGEETTPIKSKPIIGPTFIGSPFEPKPVESELPEHRYMASQGASTIHSNGANTDAHQLAGPLGHNPKVITRSTSLLPGGIVPTFAFDKEGYVLGIRGAFTGFSINLFHPRTLERLARYELPQRPSTYASLIKFDMDAIWSDTGGGAYFYLDNEDRVVLADAELLLQRIGHRKTPKGDWEFYQHDSFDLSSFVPRDCLTLTNWFPSGECDSITSVLPDERGFIWWVTRNGRLGTVNTADGAVKMIDLEEEVQNAIAVAGNSVFAVSGHAMYEFTAGKDGTPEIVWREEYDRGSGRKEGLIYHGAGPTPTLMGRKYVALVDNADDRPNLLVLRQSAPIEGERTVCKLPLPFKEGQAGAVEASLVTWSNSLLVKNDAGYVNPMQQKEWGWDQIPGGIHRIDVREDESGCDLIWTNPERAPGNVAKLSSPNGLTYYYGVLQQEGGANASQLFAIDVETGETVFKIVIGAGIRYDSSLGSVAIGPEGVLYVTTFNGFVAIWDEPN